MNQIYCLPDPTATANSHVVLHALLRVSSSSSALGYLTWRRGMGTGEGDKYGDGGSGGSWQIRVSLSSFLLNCASSPASFSPFSYVVPSVSSSAPSYPLSFRLFSALLCVILRISSAPSSAPSSSPSSAPSPTPSSAPSFALAYFLSSALSSPLTPANRMRETFHRRSGALANAQWDWCLFARGVLGHADVKTVAGSACTCWCGCEGFGACWGGCRGDPEDDAQESGEEPEGQRVGGRR